MSLCIHKKHEHAAFEPNERVCIAGGGISGMFAAYLLATQEPRYVVRLHERSGRLGGALHEVLCPNDKFMSQIFRSNHTHIRALLDKFGIKYSKVVRIPFYASLEGSLAPYAIEDVMPILQRSPLDSKVEDVITSDMKEAKSPFYEEMRKFRIEDYVKSEADLSKGVEAFFVPGGYLSLIQYMKDSILHAHPDNRVTCYSMIQQVRHYGSNAGDGLIVKSSDKGDHYCKYFIAALSKPALQRLVHVSMAMRWAQVACDACTWVPSFRVYAKFSKDVFRIQSFTNASTFPVHIYDADSNFKWATIISPKYALISYVDGNDALVVASLRHQLGDEEAVNFLLHELLCKLDIDIDASTISHDFLISTSDAGFHVNDVRDFKTSVPIKNTYSNIFLAGEMVAPPHLRAWMEGAFESASTCVEALRSPSRHDRFG